VSNYNPTDIRAQAQRKQANEVLDRAKRQELSDDINWLMADARGRRLMRQWLAFCGVDQTSFTGDSKTFFREGGRNVGLMLKGQLVEHALEGYFTMLREHAQEAQEDAALRVLTGRAGA
jgi:hypothetical protein